MTLEGLRLKLRNNVIFPLTAKSRQKKLKNKSFTIISNNCWGGTVYESYALQKQSPTVGMFFVAADYIRFLKRLDEYLNAELEFVAPEKSMASKYAFVTGDPRFGSYPVGKISLGGEDIEIMFLHYHSEQEAREKWNRRKSRINRDRLLVKFNDQNACSHELAREFDALPFKNKVFFTVSDDYADIACAVRLKCDKGCDTVQASREPFGANKALNVNDLINNLDS